MILNLPVPEAEDPKSLEDCIQSRRSIREYSELPVSISYLSKLLWSAQSITGANGERATPSANGLHPLHLHVLVRRVKELEAGIYEYRIDDHSLQLVDGLPSDRVMKEVGIGDQPWLIEAAFIIGVSADLTGANERFKSQPPGERGKRYVYMETGAMAQNVYLSATDLELGCVLVAGFNDFQTKKILRLSSELEPAALICIGHRR
ncbi:SagB/ThcOx family dehydrogenase [Marinobacter salarius]|uniref:SagB/ThcOx family dehydrogenase n=1 Tax=Marinobacter salarius TaxID=1420917 RepID=UPI003D0D3E27